MKTNAPIGVFDSGIGGLTVVKELAGILPNENIVYVGDSARAPYGSRPPAEIIRFMHQILRFMAAQGVKMVVMACNTTTVLGLEIARHQYPFMIVGMNRGVKSALAASKAKNIGVIATQATIASGKHGESIKVVNPQATVYPQACPKFVPLIEQEHIDDALIKDAVVEYLTPIKDAGVDALILGCTHYPIISKVIGEVIGTEVALVDPAKETALDAYNMLKKSAQLANEQNGPGKISLYFSSELDRAKRMAGCILGDMPLEFGKVNLQDFS